MKTYRNKLKMIVYGMKIVERENMNNIVDDMEAISVKRDSLKKILEEKNFMNIRVK